MLYMSYPTADVTFTLSTPLNFTSSPPPAWHTGSPEANGDQFWWTERSTMAWGGVKIISTQYGITHHCPLPGVYEVKGQYSCLHMLNTTSNPWLNNLLPRAVFFTRTKLSTPNPWLSLVLSMSTTLCRQKPVSPVEGWHCIVALTKPIGE